MNILEFIGCPCYHVDSLKIMTVGEAVNKSCADRTTNRDTELIVQTCTANMTMASKNEGGTSVSGPAGTSNPLNNEPSNHQMHKEMEDVSSRGRGSGEEDANRR
jgi:hypothetical protein